MPEPMMPVADVRDRPVGWLWAGRIPVGAITVVEGKPGSNKSSLLYDLAARVSTDRPMPGESRRGVPAGSTALLYQAEDPPSRVREMLLAAGGDASRVYVYKAGPSAGARQVSLPDDTAFVGDEVKRLNARLVVFDPFTLFLSGSVNSDGAVRRALDPLAAMADETEAAVVLVRHLRKSGGRDPLYAGVGSIAVTAASRSVLVVAQHPVDPLFRVVAQSRSTFGLQSPSLKFVPGEEGARGLRLTWRGSSPFTAEQLLADDGSAGGSAVGEAVGFLVSVLRAGPLPATEVKRLAGQATISERTLRRAKEVLGIKSEREGFGVDGVYRGVLPADNEVARLIEEQEQRPALERLIVRKRRKIEFLD